MKNWFYRVWKGTEDFFFRFYVSMNDIWSAKIIIFKLHSIDRIIPLRLSFVTTCCIVDYWELLKIGFTRKI